MDPDISTILQAIDSGDPKAASELLPFVYEQLRALAAKRISAEAPGQTLQATALVHEAYAKRARYHGNQWRSKAHFFAAAAEAMRRILIDRARAKKRDKRGGTRKRFDLTAADLMVDAVPDEILDLEVALQSLAKEDRIKAQLVELRFFGGMSMSEAAQFLGISSSTADRYWTYARAFLYAELRDQVDG
jgi:RNA polymerase sigma factor (TIGR02999 family)